MINIEDTITEAINAEKEEREIKSWHISKIGACPRGAYLERQGVPPDTDFDNRTLRVFSVGNMFEDWLIKLVQEKVGGETQVRVEDKELDVSGRIDLLIPGKAVYEIKTKHSKAFWWMVKKGAPMRQHQYQTWVYLKLLGLQKGHIVYLSKDDLAIQQYNVKLDDADLEAEVMEWLQPLNEVWRGEQDASTLWLPEDGMWQANYCRYHLKCKQL